MKVVLDANAFINNVSFSNQESQYYITQNAIAEIKDHQAKERLRMFPYKLNISTPSDHSIKFVKSFAYETGDISTLSYVDTEIIALAHTLVEENGKLNLLRRNPPKPVEFNAIKNANQGVQEKQLNVEQSAKEQNEESPKQAEDDDDWIEVVDNRKKKIEQQPAQEIEVEESEEEDEEEDDDQEWINEDNLHLNGCKVDDSNRENELGVSVMTTDYAMQMMIPIISFEGLKIKSARRFVLECHICKIVYRDPTKLFCSSCGNNSLLKVSCSVNNDGTLILYRKRNFKINLRGTQYDIPKNKSKKGMPFIYTEDQLLMRGIQQKIQRQQKHADQKYKKLLENYSSGYGFEDVEFKQHKSQKVRIGYGNLNPNDKRDARKIKRQV